MSDKTCQRRVFRIQYPDEARAQLTAFAHEYKIVDCSEAGMSYELNGAPPPTSQAINGQILFGAGTTVDFSGFVLRVQDGRVALKFAKNLPPSLIMNEQRWLRARKVAGDERSDCKG